MERDRIEIYIPRGATLEQIADTLVRHQLLASKEVFKLWATLSGSETKLRAGYFEIPRKLNSVQLVSFLVKAKPKETLVTLIEGWTIKQMAAELSRKLKLNPVVFDSLCRDSNFIRTLGLEVADLTGYLLPDTYAFYRGMDASQIIALLVGRTWRIFEADSVQRAIKNLGMNRHQILTLASIVEGEAIFDEERPLVASVYLNRLERGMRLQADPTIQFLLDGPPRRLLLKDLLIDSPYNTYRYYGLPPAPINNPGLKSILATLFAENTKYLYFVARGDGKHSFSSTLEEHNRAKRSLDRIRKELQQQNLN